MSIIFHVDSFHPVGLMEPLIMLLLPKQAVCFPCGGLHTQCCFLFSGYLPPALPHSSFFPLCSSNQDTALRGHSACKDALPRPLLGDGQVESGDQAIVLPPSQQPNLMPNKCLQKEERRRKEERRKQNGKKYVQWLHWCSWDLFLTPKPHLPFSDAHGMKFKLQRRNWWNS